MQPNKKGVQPALERLEERLVPTTYLGNEFLVNTTTSDAQENPSVAMNASGAFVAVWESDATPGVVAQRYDASGVAQGGEIAIDTPTQFADADPAVAIDAAGNFVVAWFNDADNTVRARRFAADGTPAGASFQVAALALTASNPVPSVAITASGFTIGWDNNDDTIHARLYDAGGNLVDEVNHAVGHAVQLPRVGATAAGDFVATYTDGPEFGVGTVYAQRFSAAGDAVGGEVVVSADATNRTPVVGVRADGSFVVAWAGSSGGIFARHYDAGGAPLAGATQLDSPFTEAEATPTVGVDADGNFVVAWRGNETGQTVSDIYAIRGSAAGFTFGSAFLVNPTLDGRHEAPSVAVSPAGDRFVVAWHRFTTSGSPDIFAQRFEVGPNHAPVLDPSGEPTFTFVAQDATDPHGDTVASLIGTSITDEDLGSLPGIAIVGLTGTASGTWEFSTDDGASWAPIGAAAESNARLLRSFDLVRFVPNAGFLGSATMTYRAWDWSFGTVGGTADVTATGTGGATAFSTATETATLTVTPTGNHAPVLDNSGSPTLTEVPLNQVTVGNSVAEIVGDTITDRNHDALEGIAVVGLTGTANGTWQYSTNGGFSWTPIGAVSTASALLLRDLDRVRFIPNAEFEGPATLTYHAWDQTAGTPGGVGDLTTIDPVASPFSVAQETASLTVARWNLVGRVLNVYGTPGDDTLSFIPGDGRSISVVLNGETRVYEIGNFTSPLRSGITVIFHAREGNDTANVDMRLTVRTPHGGIPLWGAADLYEDYARLHKASGFVHTLEATGYDLTLSDVENVFLSADVGDVVNLYDSAGDDTFVSTPTLAYLSTPNSFFVVSGPAGFAPGRSPGFIQAHSRYGTDAAWFYDSAGDDAFYANAASGVAYLAGTGFFNYAYGFEAVNAVATAGGADTAYLNDGPFDDLFVGGAASSSLTGPGYAYTAQGFDLILAQALAGGVDLARILDPSRNIASGFQFI